MTPIRNLRSHGQRGSTLIAAIVLLLLLAVASLFALSVGMFEQRTSGNDLRAKVVQRLADTAVSQGMAYFTIDPARGDILADDGSDTGLWELCDAADTTFPCGAVVAARRSTMFRYKAGAADIDGSGTVSTLEERMLPVATPTEPVAGGFTARSGVGAVLCMVRQPLTGVFEDMACTTDQSKASQIRVFTLVGVGSIPGEGANATVVQTFGNYSLIGNPQGKPPVVASGTIDLTGTLQVVTNPNAGGPGVPVSVWTRKDTEKTGTPNSCYMDDWIRYGAKNATLEYRGTSPPIIACDDCSCTDEHTISYSGSGSNSMEGIDILDIDPGTEGDVGDTLTEGVNYDINPNEFPCDMFEFTFSKKAWTDENNDYFCEKPIPEQYTTADDVTQWMGADEAYLYEHATAILPIPANDDKPNADQLKTVCDESWLNEDLSGIVWIQQSKDTCTIDSAWTVGSPDHPVVLVLDGDSMIHGTVYGLVFVRSASGVSDGDPDGTVLSEATGGTGVLRLNAGGVVYGSVIVQGIVFKANGTAAVIYNQDVLKNLARLPSNTQAASVPGSWNDRVAYTF